MLHYVQHDNLLLCHSERSEESQSRVGGLRVVVAVISSDARRPHAREIAAGELQAIGG
jgi:hypothetical protein